MTKWEITLDQKCIIRRNLASKVMSSKDIFPENFMEIEQEMAEKIANQTRTKNNNNTEK